LVLPSGVLKSQLAGRIVKENGKNFFEESRNRILEGKKTKPLLQSCQVLQVQTRRQGQSFEDFRRKAMSVDYEQIKA